MRTRKDGWSLRAGESMIDAHEDVVLTMFRRGDSLRKIGEAIGFQATSVRNWLVAQGEYDRVVTCALPGCEETFPFRPRKQFCCKNHAKISGHKKIRSTPEGKQKQKARNVVRKALQNGVLTKPDECSRCGKPGAFGSDGRSLLQADHHNGYDDEHLLDVVWICHRCDRDVEAARKGKSMAHSKEARAERKKQRGRLTLTVDGETKLLTEWATETGISYETLFGRVRTGWSPEEVVRTPVLRRVR